MVLHPANGNHTATLALEKQKGLASTYTLTPVFLGSPTWARTRDLRINSSTLSPQISISKSRSAEQTRSRSMIRVRSPRRQSARVLVQFVCCVGDSQSQSGERCSRVIRAEVPVVSFDHRNAGATKLRDG